MSVIKYISILLAATMPATHASVFPKSASSLPVVQLSTLVLDAMPAAGATGLSWDHMLDAPVAWMTTGYSAWPSGKGASRTAFARVRVGTQTFTILRKAKDELAWTVTLDVDGNPKFGPESITIKPGGDGATACFGSLTSGCTFNPDLAVHSSKLQVRKLCDKGGVGHRHSAYLLEADGRRSMFADYIEDGGSGGYSGWLELTLARLPYYSNCDLPGAT